MRLVLASVTDEAAVIDGMSSNSSLGRAISQKLATELGVNVLEGSPVRSSSAVNSDATVDPSVAASNSLVRSGYAACHRSLKHRERISVRWYLPAAGAALLAPSLLLLYCTVTNVVRRPD
eukprot:2529918-Prymnesium_polylepis.1